MVRLRAYRASDIPRLVELANNKNVSRYLIYTFPFPYTEQDAEWWVSTGARENGAVTKVIEFHDLFVGSAGIQPQSGWKDHSGEIGYWVGESYWGNGIATEALRQMTQIGFEELGLRKLFAPVLSPNVGSMKVLEKCGYEREGVLKAEVHKDDTYYDIHHFAINCIKHSAEPDA